eukprot:1958871-Rhodomonas_salina.2
MLMMRPGSSTYKLSTGHRIACASARTGALVRLLEGHVPDVVLQRLVTSQVTCQATSYVTL